MVCEHLVETVSSVESFSDDVVYEVIDIDLGSGIFTTTEDIMTSLASLVYSDMDTRTTSMSESSSDAFDEVEDCRLTLAYERLHTVPKTLLDRFGPMLKILDISHNRISNLDFLSHFKNITSLIADNNFINESTTFPHLPHLQLLWLNHCKIQTLFPWIRKLQQSCPGLKHICLMGNPAAPSYLNGGTFYEYLQYRLFVISMFPHLVHLDDRAVTEDQRTEAKRLYKRPLLERITSFSQNDAPSYIQNSAMAKWRTLHHKMLGLFENTGPSGESTSRNLLV